MLEPWGKGVVATTLRYPYEIRDAREYFDDIPSIELEPDMLKLAEQILKSKATDFDSSQFVDRYEEAVVAMLKTKLAGLPVSRGHAPLRPQPAVNLMEALRRSVARGKAASTLPPKRPRHITGQAEMPLAITGKNGKQPRSGARQQRTG
jgi:DNA end-binding protein Ku